MRAIASAESGVHAGGTGIFNFYQPSFQWEYVR